jgi:hypothetical protein
MDMGILQLRRSAHGVITRTIRTLALPTVTTVRAGLSVDSLSAPDRGIAATGVVVAMATVAAAMAMATVAG